MSGRTWPHAARIGPAWAASRRLSITQTVVPGNASSSRRTSTAISLSVRPSIRRYSAGASAASVSSRLAPAVVQKPGASDLCANSAARRVLPMPDGPDIATARSFLKPLAIALSASSRPKNRSTSEAGLPCHVLVLLVVASAPAGVAWTMTGGSLGSESRSVRGSDPWLLLVSPIALARRFIYLSGLISDLQPCFRCTPVVLPPTERPRIQTGSRCVGRYIPFLGTGLSRGAPAGSWGTTSPAHFVNRRCQASGMFQGPRLPVTAT